MADKAEKQISTRPLKEGFYRASSWLDTMLAFYCDQHKYMPREVLGAPLKLLCKDIENVMILEMNLPDLAYAFLNQVVNPLFEPQEYRDKVWGALKKSAEEMNDQRYIILANSLLNMRCFFERNSRFLQEHFAKDIAMVPNKKGPEEQLNTFSELMQGITSAHVKQITDLLAARE